MPLPPPAPPSPRLLGLLSPPGRQCGAALMFLPCLRSLAATDVTTDWLHSLALFCPRLTSLAITRCDIMLESFLTNVQPVISGWNLMLPRGLALMSRLAYSQLP